METLRKYKFIYSSWCPTADCEYIFFFSKEDETRFECPECKK